MNPLDFLEVADEWIVGLREAEWRSAVSRAYYAVFHVVRQLLHKQGFAVPDNDQAHGYLWLRLSNAGHPDVGQAGRDLWRLRSVRNWADYDLNRDFPHDHALDQLETAANLAQLLQAVAATPSVLTQITDAIRIYERDVLKQVTWKP